MAERASRAFPRSNAIVISIVLENCCKVWPGGAARLPEGGCPVSSRERDARLLQLMKLDIEAAFRAGLDQIEAAAGCSRVALRVKAFLQFTPGLALECLLLEVCRSNVAAGMTFQFLPPGLMSPLTRGKR